MALICLEKQCLGVFRGFFVVFSWLFRGPHFGQILRVLALEESSDFLASKTNFPGRWWIQKPYQNQETISTTEIFPLWLPFFLAKTSSSLEQGGVCFLFPSKKKHAFSCRNMDFPAGKSALRGAPGRKPHEIAEGFQGSRTKSTSQLSQEHMK